MNTLAGIRVLDLSRLLPGPYATQLLADLGADVVKIERLPEGDYMRIIPPMFEYSRGGTTELLSAVFAQVNRGKRSVGLDFSSSTGREALLRLSQTADVLVESFRPGALARRGLGYQDFRAVNPRLIYCSLSGYGQEGPYRNRAGHDINYLALAGLLRLNAASGQSPIPMPTQVADLSGGMAAAVQILAALVGRQRTGQGCYLDLALFDAAVDWMQTILGAMYRAEQRDPQPGGMPLTGRYPCYGIYETADGAFMSLGALEPNFWKSFCEALGREDLVERQLDAEAIPLVADIFKGRTRSQWIEFAEQVDVCLEPLLEISETLTHRQVLARGHVAADERRVPHLGEDTLSVLKEAGFTAAEIQDLIEMGTIADDE